MGDPVADGHSGRWIQCYPRDRRGEMKPPTATLLPELIRLARDDSSGLVRLVLASTLQRLPVEQRPAPRGGIGQPCRRCARPQFAAAYLVRADPVGRTRPPGFGETRLALPASRYPSVHRPQARRRNGNRPGSVERSADKCIGQQIAGVSKRCRERHGGSRKGLA